MATVSARETAYKMLRYKIVNLELKPGQALSDKELTEQLGMSRTPVREALLMLNLVNLVVVRPQSGTFVAPVDLELVEMEQFTRCALEKEMVRQACSLLTADHEAWYEENLHLYEFYKNSQFNDRERKLLELDNAFHRIAFKICDRERYLDHNSMQHIERFRVLSLLAAQGNDQIDIDHRQIVQAIVERDIARAQAYVEQHMMLYRSHLDSIQRTFPDYFGSESKFQL